jgi:hypothetical protein
LLCEWRARRGHKHKRSMYTRIVYLPFQQTLPFNSCALCMCNSGVWDE